MKGRPLATTAPYGFRTTQKVIPMIPKNAIFRTLTRPALTHGAARIWAGLALTCPPFDNTVTMRQADLANMFGLSDRSSIRKYLDELKAAELIDWAYDPSRRITCYEIKVSL